MFLNGRKASNLDQINILNRKHEMFLNGKTYLAREFESPLNRKHEMFLNMFTSSCAKVPILLTVNMKCF